MDKQQENPLLKPSTLPFEALPFSEIRLEHFLPAVEHGLANAKVNIAKLRDSPQAPSFENTIVALEAASEVLDRAAECYFNLLSAEADEPFHALAAEISPKLAALSNDINLDEKIFARVKSVFDSKRSLQLSVEEARLLDKMYLGFVRNGALLSPEAKQQLRAIDQELSQLSPKFAENLLKSTNSFEVKLTKNDLDGLPQSAIDAAAQLAQERKSESAYLVTLDAPSFVPFMTYSKRRDLREKLYRAYMSRSFGGPTDNTDVLKRSAVLRHKRATLLGFKTHADYVLKERMAESPDKVFSFLSKILSAAKPAAMREKDELTAFAKKLDGLSEILPWDVSYYSQKLKEERYSLDEEALRPFFKLENVVDGVFEHARRLFNLDFKERKDIPVYHPDVRVFEVSDAGSQAHVGLFYCDFFPRKTKKGGAWMTAFREQGRHGGKVQRPHVAIVCNFTKPTASKPSLLTFDEVRTLFHEMGHALHGLLSECTYKSVAGTNVYWDFVELPSQVMENWTEEKEGLDLFARHFETGELMPASLSEKIKASSRFQAGLQTLRQISYAMLDMAWHSKDPSGVTDVAQFEEQSLSETRVFPRVDGVCTSTGFAHVFAGGYSAGYYSYKWAEVLDADTFELFREKGLFNKEVAQSFRKHVLSRGGTEHPMELYKRFRGREPDPDALLRRDGLV